MSNENEHIKLTSALSENLQKLINVQNKAIQKLPDDHRKKIKVYQKDITKIMKCVKSGDLTDLQKIIDKHAGTNNK